MTAPRRRTSLGDPRQRSRSVSKTSGRRTKYDVAVLQKALDILEALTHEPYLGLSELSLQTGASKASSFRVLTTLQSRGFVAKDPLSRKYSPGSRLIALSAAVISRIDLIRIARPVLERLRDNCGETVNLGVLSEGEILYLDILETPRSLRMSAKPGARDPLYSTSLGKAILATLPAAEAKRVVSTRPRVRKTRRTIVAVPALLAELAETRRRGYSIDDEEDEVGARCVGAALRDSTGRSVGAISIAGPAARLRSSGLAALGRDVLAAATEISSLMGWTNAAIE